MKNPKNKGSAFERQICKDLSLWISNGQNDNLLWRSSISGGRFTTGLKSNKNYKNQSGDICAIDPQGHKLTDKFSIECKHYRNIHIGSLIFGTPKDQSMLSFWGQTKKDAELAKKIPLLIVKQNNNQPLISLNIEMAKKLLPLIDNILYPIAIFYKNNLFLFDFYSFLENIKFKDWENTTN